MSKLVLIADDDNFCLIALRAIFKSLNADIVTAKDGKEAIEIYKVTKTIWMYLIGKTPTNNNSYFGHPYAHCRWLLSLCGN